VRDRGFHESTPSRLRASDLQRPFTGVRAIGLDLTVLLERCQAYEPLPRPGEAFSHETAARLYGLPLPDDRVEPLPIEVTSPPGVARARSNGVRGHVASVALPLVVHAGLPLVAAAYVWCQLAGGLPVSDLVAVGDAIVTGKRRGSRRETPLATIFELSEAARAWGSRRGARALANALTWVRVGAESRPETHLRLLLVDAGLPEPVPNNPTVLAGGEVLHPDLKYPQWRIVFEYQGDRHRTDRGRWQEDIRRKRAFEGAGWRVIEVTSDDLYVDSVGLLARVHQLIASA
jgi:hypothetical protein